MSNPLDNMSHLVIYRVIFKTFHHKSKENGVIELTEELNEQMPVRREKLKTYYDDNVDPFGGKYERTSEARQFHDDYEQYCKADVTEEEIEGTIHGSVLTKR